MSLDTLLMPICPDCSGALDSAGDFYGYTCAKCGRQHAEKVHRWNQCPRVVWLRSNSVSYTAEIPNGQLLPKGEIRGRPDLQGFKWEKWP